MTSLVVGITGARTSTTTAQLHTFRGWLLDNLPDIKEVHHGYCIGFDTMAANICAELNIPMVYHPPIISDYQGIFEQDGWPGEWKPRAEYIVRNHAIVDACHVLIAGPDGDEMKLRSGTWATVRYGRTQNKNVKILRHQGGWLPA